MKSIEAVSNSIIARGKALGILIVVARKYFDAMSKYILGMNSSEHARLSTSLTLAEAQVHVLREGVTDVKLSTLYTIYEHFSTMDACSLDLVLLLNNNEYSRASLAEMSSGQHSNMRADINRAVLHYEKYLAAGVDDDDIFSFAVVVTKANMSEYYKFLYEHHAVNKLTLELIRKLLPLVTGDDHIFISDLINEQKQQVLQSARVNVGSWRLYPVVSFSVMGNKSSQGKSSQSKEVESLRSKEVESSQSKEVESSQSKEVKSIVVSQEELDRDANNPLQGHERIIFRYNCTPATVSMLPRDLFKTLNLDWDDSCELNANFINASSRGNNIILLTRTHGTPVEFNFRGVLDKSFAEKFPIKPYSGLSKNFLARYNTTSILTDANQSPTNNIKPAIKMYSPLVDDRNPIGFIVSRLNWTVIESIDGIHYRVLGCTMQSISNTEKTNVHAKNITAVGTYTSDIPGSRILGLLIGASTLPTEYNNIHGQNIAGRIRDMFDPLAPSHISRWTAHEKVIPASEPIKNKVIAMLELRLRTQIEKVSNNRDWQGLFVSEEFIVAVNESISSVLIKNSLIDKIRSPEYTITQIARVSEIVAKFIKSIARVTEPIQDRMFKEYSREEINRILYERFSAIIKKAADLMDVDKIWTGHDLTLKEFIIAY